MSNSFAYIHVDKDDFYFDESELRDSDIFYDAIYDHVDLAEYLDNEYSKSDLIDKLVDDDFDRDDAMNNAYDAAYDNFWENFTDDWDNDFTKPIFCVGGEHIEILLYHDTDDLVV